MIAAAPVAVPVRPRPPHRMGGCRGARGCGSRSSPSTSSSPRSGSCCRTSRWATCTSSTSRGRSTPSQAMRIVGVTEAWIYPQLALAPMILALGLEWIAGLRDRLGAGGHDRRRPRRSRCSSAEAASSGRTRRRVVLARLHRCCSARSGMYRLDAVTVPARDRRMPVARAAAVARLDRCSRSATWIKVWPAALLAAAVIAVRRRLVRDRRRGRRAAVDAPGGRSPAGGAATRSASSTDRPIAACSSRRPSRVPSCGRPSPVPTARSCTTTPTSSPSR